MTPKRRKRRARPSLRVRVRTYWLVSLVVLGFVAWGTWSLARAPYFFVRAERVTGTSRVSPGDVVARAALDPRANVWLIDRRSVERRLAAIPYVDAATMNVRFPATVVFRIRERVPTGCIRDLHGSRYTIDDARRILELGCADDAGITYAVRAALDARPGAFVRDPELAALQADARDLARTGQRYRAFSHDAYGDLDAVLENGVDVRFGSDGDLLSKQRLVAPILARLANRADDIRAVDLRTPTTPVVEFR